MNLSSINNIWLFACAGLLFIQCQSQKPPTAAVNILNREFRIDLNQTQILTGENKKPLGEITFTHLDESRCPANVMCVRQGAAVASFALQTAESEKQNVRLFIGDFMANDPRNRRNRTADTVKVQLKDKAQYQLILKEVMPYPGTSDEVPKATILIKRP
jgi:hypothetical protein